MLNIPELVDLKKKKKHKITICGIFKITLYFIYISRTLVFIQKVFSTSMCQICEDVQ